MMLICTSLQHTRLGQIWHYYQIRPDGTGQDLAPPPDIASGGYGRPLPTKEVAARREMRLPGTKWGLNVPGE